MKNPDSDHELPFLELNEDIPAEWIIQERQEAPLSASEARTSASTPVFTEPATQAPQRTSSAFLLTPSGKAVLYTGLGFVLLLVFFRVPPAVVLWGLLSVFRVLFLPLAVLAFCWFVWQSRR